MKPFKLELWSTSEASEMVGLSVWTFLNRAKRKQIKPYRKQNKLENYYSRAQIDLITDKYNTIENPFVEVIRVETVYHIYPSKLNYDPNI
jgi:hypothetical protein